MIGVCMIVKDGARSIERAIASVRPHVDEVNIYDTGSTDGTPELVERLGRTGDGALLRVRRGEWRDSFAWAREQSFAMASPGIEWLVYLDADEEVVGAAELRRLAATAAPDTDAFVFYWDVERDEGGNTITESWRDRMLRRSTGFRWRGAAHAAVVSPAGHQPKLELVPRDRTWFVHHREPGRWHPGRALRLLLAEFERLGAEGAETDTLLNLANELFWRADFERAAELYELFLERLEGRAPVERAHATHQLATAVRAVGDPQRGYALELAMHAELPDSPETLVGLLEAARELGADEEAEQWAMRAIACGVPESVYVHDPLRLRIVPLLRLSELLLLRGDGDGAVSRVCEAVALAAGDPFAERRGRSFIAAAERADRVAARRALHELAGHYDPVVQARARQVWLAADPGVDADDVLLEDRSGVRRQ